MAISNRGLSVAIGAGIGAYSSDIFDDPVSGALSMGVGATVGGFMRLPESSLKQLSQVVAGPKIDIDSVNSKATAKLDEHAANRLNRRLDTVTNFKQDHFNRELYRRSSLDNDLAKVQERISNTPLVPSSKSREALRRADDISRVNAKYEEKFKRTSPARHKKIQEQKQKELAKIDKGYSKRNPYTKLKERESSILGMIEEHEKRAKAEYAVGKQNIASNLSQIDQVLLKHGIHTDGTKSDILAKIKEVPNGNKFGVGNVDLVNKITPLLDIKPITRLNGEQLGLKRITPKVYKFETNQYQELTKHFINNMGYDINDTLKVEAREKAKMFVDRAAGEPIHIVDGSISFKDNVSGTDVKIPLTSNHRIEGTNNFVRYHDAGNGNMNAVKGFNPHARDFNNREPVLMKTGKLDKNNRAIYESRIPTVMDMQRSESPEMLFSYLDKDTPITSKLIRYAESLVHHNSEESGVQQAIGDGKFNPSQVLKDRSGMVDVAQTLTRDKNGKVTGFNKLSTAGRDGMQSERDKFFTEMALQADGDTAAHLADNVSLNDLTSYQTKGYDTLESFGMGTRNNTGVGNRGTTIVDKNDATMAIESVMGEERFNRQFGSSQAIGKLDVGDMDRFNNLSTKLFDSNHVLGDGSGVFNIGNSDQLAISESSSINLGKSPTTSNKGLMNYLEDPENNKFNIDTHAPIAYNDRGEGVGLQKHFSSARVTGSHQDKSGNIILRTQAKFNPIEEGSVKLFGVGTKALMTGVKNSQFNTQVGLGLMINKANAITDETARLAELARIDGLSNDALRAEANIEVQALEKQRASSHGITAIMSAKDSGTESIQKLMNMDTKDIRSYLEKDLLIDPKTSGFDELAAIRANTKEGFNPRTAALVSLMTSPNKATGDLTATVAASWSQELRGNPAMAATFDSAFKAENLLNPVMRRSSLSNMYDFANQPITQKSLGSGIITTMVSPNRGRSIVGAGNTTKMSWVAKQNLALSGMTKEDFNLFGFNNDDALYEIRSIMGNTGDTVNDAIKGREGRFLQIMQQAPELRTELFENLFETDAKKNPFFSYELEYNKRATKEINFSRISTTRSGIFTNDEVTSLKQLDKLKYKVAVADIDLSKELNPRSKRDKEKILNTALDAYEEHVKTMLSGKNSLSKLATGLLSNNSQIMEVKPIAGQAEAYLNTIHGLVTDEEKAAGVMTNVLFVSPEAAQEKLDKLGVKMVTRPVTDGNFANGGEKELLNASTMFDRLQEAGYHDEDGKFIPLSEMITREPAQGPASTEYNRLLIDNSIKDNKDSIHTTMNNKLYAHMMSGDTDQDIMLTIGGKVNRQQFEEIAEKRAKVRNVLTNMQDIISSMRVKGKAKQVPTTGQFLEEAGGDADEALRIFGKYKVAEMSQARARKQMAAPATSLAIAMTEAMHMEFINDKDFTKFTQGRVGAYFLVENLIKSAHKDTNEFLNNQESVMDAIGNARKAYLEGGSKDAYKQVLDERLPEFLGYNDMPEGEMKDRTKAITDHITNSEIKHAKKVGNNTHTSLGINAGTSYEDIHANLSHMIANDTTVDTEHLSDIGKSLKQLSKGLNESIIDTLKNNKGVLAVGAGALAGIALLGRSEPSYVENRPQMQHSSKMMLASTPVGMDTNPTKAAYITPNSFGSSKSVRVSGDFRKDIDNENYTRGADNLSSLTEGYTNNSISSAVFGSGMRSARLETNN